MEAAKIIPQLFYDLIGRVVPGGLALVGISFAFGRDLAPLLTLPVSSLMPLRDSSLFLATVLLAASYLAGHLLSPLGDLVRPLLSRLMRGHFNILASLVSGRDTRYTPEVAQFVRREASAEEADTTMAAELLSSLIYVWADWLQVVEPDTGARLAKIRAECRLFSQCTIAALLALLAHLAALVVGLTPAKPSFMGLSLAIAILAGWNYARMFRIFQWGVINNYYATKQARAIRAEEVSSPS